MSDPHNPNRYGEVWPQDRLEASLAEMQALKPWIIVSGGWAWHFLSPKGHPELKHAHDHKDIDVFVEPLSVGTVVALLKERGFAKVRTKYDRYPSDEDFRRYEVTRLTPAERSIRITVDLFVRGDVPNRLIDGWRIVEPRFLLSLYSSIHSSDTCFAVQAAAELLERGIDPRGRAELLGDFK